MSPCGGTAVKHEALRVCDKNPWVPYPDHSGGTGFCQACTISSQRSVTHLSIQMHLTCRPHKIQVKNLTGMCRCPTVPFNSIKPSPIPNKTFFKSARSRFSVGSPSNCTRSSIPARFFFFFFSARSMHYSQRKYGEMSKKNALSCNLKFSKVNGFCSGPRPIFHPSFVKICSVVCV